ncbi:MAG: RNA polymerase sigma factor [Lachnospiraceae bacterium]|nr:RNA polymerase sigma factor [Lachnospiraceae bacterium]
MTRKSEEEIKNVIQTYGNLLYRTACVILGNPHDVQDVLQEVLIKYMEKAPAFHDAEYEKSWLLKVTVNLCKDYLRFNKRHTYVNLEQAENVCASPEQMEILKEVISLPPKWKTVLLLHYVEGYQIREISHITGLSEGAVKKRLQRGREALKQKLSNFNL